MKKSLLGYLLGAASLTGMASCQNKTSMPSLLEYKASKDYLMDAVTGSQNRADTSFIEKKRELLGALKSIHAQDDLVVTRAGIMPRHTILAESTVNAQGDTTSRTLIQTFFTSTQDSTSELEVIDMFVPSSEDPTRLMSFHGERKVTESLKTGQLTKRERFSIGNY